MVQRCLLFALLIFQGQHTMPGTTRLFLLWALSRPQRQGFSVEAVEDKISLWSTEGKYQPITTELKFDPFLGEMGSFLPGSGRWLPGSIKGRLLPVTPSPPVWKQWMPVDASGCQLLELHETLENLESWCFETGASADRRPFPPSHRIWDDWDVDWQDLPLQPDQTWMNWYLGWNTVVGTVVAVLILQLKFFRILTSNHFLIGFWSSTVMVGSSLLRNNKWFQADWFS